jgi:hypothetical protein
VLVVIAGCGRYFPRALQMMLLFFVAKYGLEIHIELPPRYKIKIRVHEMMAFALKTEERAQTAAS